MPSSPAETWPFSVIDGWIRGEGPYHVETYAALALGFEHDDVHDAD